MAMRSFDRWRALSRDERRLTLQSLVTVATAAASLRVLGVERSLQVASRRRGGPAKIVIADVAAAVERAGRYVPGATCLSNAVALAWMLRRRGVEAAVRIGIRTAGGFEAHAWVEAAGLESGSGARFAKMV